MLQPRLLLNDKASDLVKDGIIFRLAQGQCEFTEGHALVKSKDMLRVYDYITDFPHMRIACLAE